MAGRVPGLVLALLLASASVGVAQTADSLSKKPPKVDRIGGFLELDTRLLPDFFRHYQSRFGAFWTPRDRVQFILFWQRQLSDEEPVNSLDAGVRWVF